MSKDQTPGTEGAAERFDVALPATAGRPEHVLSGFRYGIAGARPKAYLQAGLHADELPGMFVLHRLRGLLDAAAAQGRIRGEILVLPQANPIGLAQQVGGFLIGRHDLATGSNFNRGYPDLAARVANRDLGGLLTDDPDANVALVRRLLRGALAASTPSADPLGPLRHALMGLAFDADLVLDLHADNEALPHLYVGTPLWPQARDVAAAIDARAVLLAEVSGGNPFDEACAGPWWTLARLHPDRPIPPACLAATLELGSNDDVDEGMAARQAEGLYRVLVRRGLVADVDRPGPVPLACEATALDAMDHCKTPSAGLVVYHRSLGDVVERGDVLATIVDPLGTAEDLKAETSGLLFARHSQPYAWPGKVVAKIAGRVPLASRTGDLLTQ